MTEQTTQEPTQAQMQDVATAGAVAAAEAPNAEQAQADARQAIRSRADELKLELSDDDVNRIVAAMVPALVTAFDERGAFDAPPDPVQAPPQATAPPAPGEQPAPAAEAVPPRKRSWAEKFLNG